MSALAGAFKDSNIQGYGATFQFTAQHKDDGEMV